MDTAVYEWLEIARDDQSVARILFQKEKYVYAVVMCQQAVEKTIKALYQHRFGKVPPRRHDLIRLADEVGILKACSDAQKTVLSTLTEFYIEARYPGDRMQLNAVCDREFARELLTGTEDRLNG